MDLKIVACPCCLLKNEYFEILFFLRMLVLSSQNHRPPPHLTIELELFEVFILYSGSIWIKKLNLILTHSFSGHIIVVVVFFDVVVVDVVVIVVATTFVVVEDDLQKKG